MNWKKIIAIGLTGCFLFSGCAEQRQNAQKMGEEGTQEDSYESTTFAMDTVMTFHIVAPDGEDLLIDAEQEVKRLEKLLQMKTVILNRLTITQGIRRLPFRQIRLPC